VRQPMDGAEIFEMHRIRGRDAGAKAAWGGRGGGFGGRRGEWVEAGCDCDRPSETEAGGFTRSSVSCTEGGMIGGGSRDREERPMPEYGEERMVTALLRVSTPRVVAHDAGPKREAGGAERGRRGERAAFIPFSHRSSARRGGDGQGEGGEARRNRQAQAHAHSMVEECNGKPYAEGLRDGAVRCHPQPHLASCGVRTRWAYRRGRVGSVKTCAVKG
jgi:hypothetical protein